MIEFLVEGVTSPRLIMQMKCIEKFRFEKHPNTSWQDSFNFWVDEGYAKLFGDLYTDDIKFRLLYRKIMESRGEL